VTAVDSSLRSSVYATFRFYQAQDRTFSTAANEIIAMDDVQFCLQLLSIPSVRRWIIPRCREYLHIYDDDCVFLLEETKQYNSYEPQLRVRARLDIPPGPIPSLVGRLQAISAAGADALGDEDTDFSVVGRTASSNQGWVLLGLARFVNHDCQPNCELVRSDGTCRIHAVTAIAKGQEITASYGLDDCGEDREGCVCASRHTASSALPPATGVARSMVMNIEPLPFL